MGIELTGNDFTIEQFRSTSSRVGSHDPNNRENHVNAKTIFLVFVLAVFVLPFVSLAQDDPCQALQAAKKRAYGFRATELSQEQKQKKSAELDHFWKQVHAQGGEGVACLRTMILAEKDDTFFLFNGSSLLYSLDRSEASLAGVSYGLSRTNLQEASVLWYIQFLVQLSKDGVDIGPLAERYMAYPDVRVTVPAHGNMPLGREEGALLLYGSMQPALADKYLVTMLAAENSERRSAAALLLSLSMTEESFKGLNSLPGLDGFSPDVRSSIEIAMKHKPVNLTRTAKFSRREVLEKLARIPRYGEDFWGFAGNEDLEASAIATLTQEDLSALREARRKSITGVSDEVLYEYFALSKILLGVINRLDLYKEYRSH